MDYYCPEWVLTARQPRREEYHRAKNSAHAVLPLFSRIPVWAEGGVGKLWRFDCPECVKAWAGISGG